MKRAANILLGLLPLLLWGEVRADALELQLAPGQQHVLSSQGVESFSEGVPGIVDVRLTKDGSQFVIVGQRPGETSLLLLMRDGSQRQYRIRVGNARAEPEPEAPRGRVEKRDNIRLDFYFVQLDEDYRHQLGVAWPASTGKASLSATLDLTAGGFTEATAMVTDQALPRLDMAQSAGWAKLLRRAAVITANGEKAQFSGGGEVNIPVESAFSIGIRQISFGSTIEVLPRYDRESGRIELAIHADVSDLSSDHGSGIPGRTTSTVDSVVNLELGQSLVLAGLSAHSEASSHAGLPLLSQIPILGGLFGTHGNRSERTENLVFIVPTVVDSVSLDAREQLRDALRSFRDFDGDFGDTALPRTPTRKRSTP